MKTIGWPGHESGRAVHPSGGRPSRAIRALAALVVLQLGTPVVALDPAKSISQFGHRVWQDELPQNTVHSIVQSTEGYLWVATYEGVARFDGVKFELFDTLNSPGLRGTSVYQLIARDGGGLWLATSQGLARYEGGSFETLTSADGLPSDVVLSIGLGGDGRLWVGTDQGLALLRRGQIEPVEPLDPLLREAIRGLAVGPDGVVWLATDRGLGRLEERRLQVYTTADGLPSDTCRGVTVASDGTTWVGTTAGLVGIPPNGAESGREITEVLTVADGLPDDFTRVAHLDRDGTFWIGSEESGLSRYRDGEMETFGSDDGLSNDFVRSIFEDREGNVWVGTNGGLNQFQETKFTTWTTGEGLPNDFVRSIAEAPDGSIWVGTGGGGVTRFREGVWETITTVDGLTNDTVLAVMPMRDGSVWVGTRLGLNHLTVEPEIRVRQTLTVDDALPSDLVRALYEDRAGRLWVGTEGGGLLLLDRGEVTTLGTADGLVGDDVRAITEDGQGRLWIGTFSGLSSLENGTFQSHTTADGLSLGIVFEIHEDLEGEIWVGTERGLHLLRGDRFVSIDVSDGLFDNKVFRILEDDRGFFWMSSNRGLSRVRRSALLDLVAGRIERVTTEAFTRQDGMEANQCNGASQPAGWRDRSGRLWFPTIKGIVVVLPSELESNPLPPPVVIEAVRINETLQDPWPTELRHDHRNLELDYTGLSFVTPEKVAFRYRLEGFDDRWVEAGGRRTAYFTHLPPGSYRFQVTAANSDGVWNETGATWSFVVRPSPWTTWWAFGLYALGASALVGGTVHLRLRALGRRNELLELRVAERTAVIDQQKLDLAQKVEEAERSQQQARESEQQALQANQAKTVFLSNMSHELRTPLNSIIGFASILQERLADQVSERQANFLAYIVTSGRHLLRLINDLLDLSKIEAGHLELDRQRFTAAWLLEGIRDVMRGVVIEKGIEIEVEIEEQDLMLTADPVKMKQIVFNLLSNAVKFSPAHSTVTLRAARVDGEASPLGVESFRLDVIDRGIGVDPEHQELIFEAFRQIDAGLSREYEGTGLGLTLVQQLVSLHRGRVDVRSARGEGATFTVHLPQAPLPDQALD